MAAIASPTIHGHGTPEQHWQPWLARQALPTVTAATLLHPCQRVVVVAPHPDDEVLGLSGILLYCAAAALDCVVIYVTDGDASHPGSPCWPPQRLAQVRAQESAQALALLAPHASICRLGMGDGRIAEHAPQLAGMLRQHLQPGDALLCPWRLDGHPDHDATGQVCAAIASDTGCLHIEVPIWAWHWATPGDLRVPWHRAVTLALTPEQQARKQLAVACFRSQLQPDPSTGREAILPPWALQRLLRPFEVVLR